MQCTLFLAYTIYTKRNELHYEKSNSNSSGCYISFSIWHTIWHEFHKYSNSAHTNSKLLGNLYHKSEDEPDFDCEFLHAAHDLNEYESIIDPESDDQLLDEFNDNQWDADIYDPYVESTYY